MSTATTTISRPQGQPMPEHDNRREKDAPLRQDIRVLGNALGQAILRHGGPAVFDTVEQLRHNCIRLRECTEKLSHASSEEASPLQDEIAALTQEIAHTVDNCDLDTAIDVIRAFTAYFHLVNTAEQYHRIRRRRSHEASDSSKPQRGSLPALINFLQTNKLDATTVQQLLDQLSIELVFTAHPTEATRRSLITKSRHIAELLEAHDIGSVVTPRQQASWRRDLEGTIDLVWRTDAIRRVRPQLLDEIKMGIYYLNEILYDAVPDLYTEFEELLHESYPQVSVPPFLRLGSWIGGDQDGNPFVGPDTLLTALHLQQYHVIEHYRTTLAALAREYSQSLNHARITPALQRSLDDDAARLPDYDHELGPQATLEPYRRKFSFMWKRLEATLSAPPPPLTSTWASAPLEAASRPEAMSISYNSAEELLADLQLIRTSLLADGELDLAQGEL
ncbi:MAG: phosphoenolpyruvate carboxylase, partial [Chloroflexi bacterium]|nr:phosphoenolpyruvate carboxylase [Chloroflexota bacterium]